MKKVVYIILLAASLSAFADNENYNYQDVSWQSFYGKSLINSRWIESNATLVDFRYTTLTNANFTSANLTLANFENAKINNANFSYTVSNGFTKEQLYSTKSYKDKDLSGVVLKSNDLSSWDFSEQNLTSASFLGAMLTNANFENAKINNADFLSAVSNGFTKEQLYSTKSYKDKDLSGVVLVSNNLSGWNFSEQNLTWAQFSSATLTNANFAGANLTWAHFNNATLTNVNFTNENLTSARFYKASLTNTDFTGANLTSAYFHAATLTNANLTNATINNAYFGGTVSCGFTKEQLYSTKSYKEKILVGIDFSSNDMNNWDFNSQNLASAGFDHSTLTDANFTGANLTSANFYYATLTDTNFTGANLTSANFNHITLTNVNFAFSDLRGADMTAVSGDPIYKTTIVFYGVIKNFSMNSVEDFLVVRKYTPTGSKPMISAKISEANATVSGGAVLTLENGAELEVIDERTLTIAGDGNLIINTDAESSTSFTVASGAGLAFENGAVLRVNVEGAFAPSEGEAIVVMSWADGAHITGANLFVVDETIFLTVNGEAYSGGWDYKVVDNQFQIVFEQIPEPAFWAAVLGVFALAFAARRRRAK